MEKKSTLRKGYDTEDTAPYKEPVTNLLCKFKICQLLINEERNLHNNLRLAHLLILCPPSCSSVFGF